MEDETKTIDTRLDFKIDDSEFDEVIKKAEQLEKSIQRLVEMGKIKPVKSLGNLIPEAIDIERLIPQIEKVTDAAIGKVINSTIDRISRLKPGNEMASVLEARWHQLEEVLTRRMEQSMPVERTSGRFLPDAYKFRQTIDPQKIAAAGVEKQYEQLKQEMSRLFESGTSHGAIQRVRDDFNRRINEHLGIKSRAVKEEAKQADSALDSAFSSIDDIMNMVADSIEDIGKKTPKAAPVKQRVKDAARKAASDLVERANDYAEQYEEWLSSINSDTKRGPKDAEKALDRLDAARAKFFDSYDAANDREINELRALLESSKGHGSSEVIRLLRRHGKLASEYQAAYKSDDVFSDVFAAADEAARKSGASFVEMVDELKTVEDTQQKTKVVVDKVVKDTQSRLLVVAKELMELSHSRPDDNKIRTLSNTFARLSAAAASSPGGQEELAAVGAMAKAYSRRTGFNPQPVFRRAVGAVHETDDRPTRDKAVADVAEMYGKQPDGTRINSGFETDQASVKRSMSPSETGSLSAAAQKILDLQFRIRSNPNDGKLQRELKGLIRRSSDEELGHAAASIKQFYGEEIGDKNSPDVNTSYAAITGAIKDREGAVKAFEKKAEADFEAYKKAEKERDAAAGQKPIGELLGRGVRVKHRIYPQNDPDQTVYDRRAMPTYSTEQIRQVREQRRPFLDEHNALNAVLQSKKAELARAKETNASLESILQLEVEVNHQQTLVSEALDKTIPLGREIDDMMSANASAEAEANRKVHVRTRLGKSKIASRNRTLVEDNAQRSSAADALQQASDARIAFEKARDAKPEIDEETLRRRQKAMADSDLRTLRSRPRNKPPVPLDDDEAILTLGYKSKGIDTMLALREDSARRRLENTRKTITRAPLADDEAAYDTHGKVKTFKRRVSGAFGVRETGSYYAQPQVEETDKKRYFSDIQEAEREYKYAETLLRDEMMKPKGYASRTRMTEAGRKWKSVAKLYSQVLNRATPEQMSTLQGGYYFEPSLNRYRSDDLERERTKSRSEGTREFGLEDGRYVLRPSSRGSFDVQRAFRDYHNVGELYESHGAEWTGEQAKNVREMIVGQVMKGTKRQLDQMVESARLAVSRPDPETGDRSPEYRDRKRAEYAILRDAQARQRQAEATRAEEEEQRKRHAQEVAFVTSRPIYVTQEERREFSSRIPTERRYDKLGVNTPSDSRIRGGGTWLGGGKTSGVPSGAFVFATDESRYAFSIKNQAEIEERYKVKMNADRDRAAVESRGLSSSDTFVPTHPMATPIYPVAREVTSEPRRRSLVSSLVGDAQAASDKLKAENAATVASSERRAARFAEVQNTFYMNEGTMAISGPRYPGDRDRLDGRSFSEVRTGKAIPIPVTLQHGGTPRVQASGGGASPPLPPTPPSYPSPSPEDEGPRRPIKGMTEEMRIEHELRMEQAIQDREFRENMNSALQREERIGQVVKLDELKAKNEAGLKRIEVLRARTEGRAPVLGTYAQMYAGEELEAAKRRRAVGEGSLSQEEYRQFREEQLHNRTTAKLPENDKFMLYGVGHRRSAESELGKIAAERRRDQEKAGNDRLKDRVRREDADHAEMRLYADEGTINPVEVRNRRASILKNRANNIGPDGDYVLDSATRQRALNELRQIAREEKREHDAELRDEEEYNKSMRNLHAVSNDELKQYYVERLSVLNQRSREASRIRGELYKIEKEEYGDQRASQLEKYRSDMMPARRRMMMGSVARSSGMALSGFGQGATYGLTVPLMGTGFASIKDAIDFQSQFKTVEQMTQGELGKTPAEENAGRERLRKFTMAESIKTGIGTDEVNKAEATAAQLGIVRKEGAPGLEKYTDTVLKMGEAIKDMDPETAARKMAQLMNVTQTGSKEVHQMASELAQLHKVGGAATSKDMLELSLRIAGIGKAVGMTPDQIIAIGSAVAASGVKAEQGGTSVQRFILQMSLAAAQNEADIKKLRKHGEAMGIPVKEMDKNQKSLAQFAAVAGVSPGDFEKMFEKDEHGVSHAAEAVDRFTAGLMRLQKEGKNVDNILAGMGIKQQRMFATLLQTTNAGLVAKFLAEGAAAYQADQALESMFDDRMTTTQKKMDKVKQALHVAGLELGTSFLPIIDEKILPRLESMAESADHFAKEISGWSDNGKEALLFLGSLVALAGPAAIFVGGLTSAVGNMLTAIGTLKALKAGVPLAEIVTGRFESSSSGEDSRKRILQLSAEESQKQSILGKTEEAAKHAEEAVRHAPPQTVSTVEKVLGEAGDIGNIVAGGASLKNTAKDLRDVEKASGGASRGAKTFLSELKRGADIKLFEGLTSKYLDFAGKIATAGGIWTIFKAGGVDALTAITGKLVFFLGKVGIIGATVMTAYEAIKGIDFGDTPFGKFLDKLNSNSTTTGHVGGLWDIATAMNDTDAANASTANNAANPVSPTIARRIAQQDISTSLQKQIDAMNANIKTIKSNPGSMLNQRIPGIQDDIAGLQRQKDQSDRAIANLKREEKIESLARKATSPDTRRERAGAAFSPEVERLRGKAIKYGSIYGVDPDYVLSVIEHESGGKSRNADGTIYKSAAGAMGVMQLMPGKQGVTDYGDEDQNMNAGVRELAQNLKKYKGDYALASAGYNAGMGAVDKYGGVPPYKDTQKYVKGVVGKYQAVKSYEGKPIAPFDPKLFDIKAKHVHERDEEWRAKLQELKGPTIDTESKIQELLNQYDSDGDIGDMKKAKDLINQEYGPKGPRAKQLDAARHDTIVEYPDRRGETQAVYSNSLKQMNVDRLKRLKAIEKKIDEVSQKNKYAVLLGSADRGIEQETYEETTEQTKLSQHGTYAQQLAGVKDSRDSAKKMLDMGRAQAAVVRDAAKDTGKKEDEEAQQAYLTTMQKLDHDYHTKNLELDQKERDINDKIRQQIIDRIGLQTRLLVIEGQSNITAERKKQIAEETYKQAVEQAKDQEALDLRSTDPGVRNKATNTMKVAEYEATVTRANSLRAIETAHLQSAAQLDRTRAENTDDLLAKQQLLNAARQKELESVLKTNDADAIALELEKQRIEVQKDRFDRQSAYASRDFATFLARPVPAKGAPQQERLAQLTSMNESLNQYEDLATNSSYTDAQRSAGISQYSSAIEDVLKRKDLSPRQALIRAVNAINDTKTTGTASKQDYDTLHNVAKDAEFQTIDERVKAIKKMSPWDQTRAAKRLQDEIKTDPVIAQAGVTQESLDHFKEQYKGAIKEIGQDFEKTMGDATKSAVQDFIAASLDPSKRKNAGKQFQSAITGSLTNEVARSVTNFGSAEFNKAGSFFLTGFKNLTGIRTKEHHGKDDKKDDPTNQDGTSNQGGQVKAVDSMGSAVGGAISGAAKEIPKATKQSKADLMAGAGAIMGAAAALAVALNPKKAKKSAMGGLLGLVGGAVIGSLVPGAGWMAGAEFGSGAGAMLGGLFAKGGDPPVGMPSIVGEQGPELFVPKTAGTIISHNESIRMASQPRITQNDLGRNGLTSADPEIVGLLKQIADKQMGTMNVSQNIHGDVHKEVELDNATLELGRQAERLLRN